MAQTVKFLAKFNPHSINEIRYQRFSNIYEQVQPAPSTQPKEDATATPFQRSAPIYWTLQSRRSQPRPQPTGNVTCRDDLYATPIRRADRLPRPAAAAASAAEGSRSNISPIVPRNRAGAFLTSTPTRGGEGDAETSQVPPMKQPSRNWSDDAPERLNTCADRIGQSKTTLMDFKKLLLAKSAKASPVQRKVSAVELLKKTTQAAPSPVPAHAPAPKTSVAGQKAPSTGSKPTINSSLKLLDLSGSPKTFANRRMLRQGQFGSPSKTFAPKMRGPVNVVAAAAAPSRTDIMSTTIPEANSEEDQSNTSGGSRASSEAGETTTPSSFDLKRNFFLQTEENNFMRGELKPSFARANGAAGGVGGVGGAGGAGAEGNKYVAAPVANPQLPSFETAL
ncbi:hypothetical protein M5D96_000239 [Drosophila gunungcola]|uniref:WASP family protein member n=1 Tax=Drosophila gunungcola TaxID=103775 RepID=A0A9Q0BUB4_9MUSC|nr:hypothetical protein M5D96_000239 [Drosophila gunungcola]